MCARLLGQYTPPDAYLDVILPQLHNLALNVNIRACTLRTLAFIISGTPSAQFNVQHMKSIVAAFTHEEVLQGQRYHVAQKQKDMDSSHLCVCPHDSSILVELTLAVEQLFLRAGPLVTEVSRELYGICTCLLATPATTDKVLLPQRTASVHVFSLTEVGQATH